MKRLLQLFLLMTITVLSSCSWESGFYIINKTSNQIIITYTLTSSDASKYEYALKESLEFYNLTVEENPNPNKNNIDDSDLIGAEYQQDYSKQTFGGNETYTITLKPNTAICGGHQLPYFTYTQKDKRHQIFNNVLQMTVIRLDTKDTVTLKPALLSDFSRPFGKYDIALIFD